MYIALALPQTSWLGWQGLAGLTDNAIDSCTGGGKDITGFACVLSRPLVVTQKRGFFLARFMGHVYGAATPQSAVCGSISMSCFGALTI